MLRHSRNRFRSLNFETCEERRLLAGLTLNLPDGTAPFVPSGPIQADPVTGQPQGLDIVFNLGPNIIQNTAAVAALEEAAAELESLIADPITLFIDIDIDPTLPDGTLGGAIATDELITYDQLRPLLIDDALNEPIAIGADPLAPIDDQIILSLPETEDLRFNLPAGVSLASQATTTTEPTTGVSVPINGGVGVTANEGLLTINRSQLKALGELLPTDPTYLEPDGSIVFGDADLFDFDASNGIDSDAFDFRAVALHEIGHVLGFIASTDQIVDGIISPTIFDLYRFPRDVGQFDPQTPEQFSSVPGSGPTLFPRELRPNVGAQVDFVLPFFGQEEVAFPLADVFSGMQTSHFADVDSQVETPIGVLEPIFEPGVIGQLSLADLRAFDLIGWDIIAPDLTPDLSGEADLRLNPLDVNADGAVSPLDALLVINELVSGDTAGTLSAASTVFDTNADGLVTPIDALSVINYLVAETSADTDEVFTQLGRASDDETEEQPVIVALGDSLLF